MIKDYWISCNRMTGLVKVEDNIIISGAPVFRKFMGQNFDNLKKWINKFNNVKIKELKA